MRERRVPARSLASIVLVLVAAGAARVNAEPTAPRKTKRAQAAVAQAARPGALPLERDRLAAIPAPLRPWIEWASKGADAQVRCPPLHGEEDARVCAWPSRLAIAVSPKGATFTQEWRVFAKSLVPLPGDGEHWPQRVRVGDRPAPVAGSDDEPRIELGPGRHLVTGRFDWDTPPEQLPIPDETGLVELRVDGRLVPFPLRDSQGLFLGARRDAAQADSVEITVHRKVIDETPLVLVTRVVLAVAGKSRELALGRALPSGFVPDRVTSPLPVRLGADGKLVVQGRPGNWQIEIGAHRTTPAPVIARPAPDGVWQAGAEVWVFEARPALRTVAVEGAPAIDPAQTTLPETWRTLPAYAVAPGAALTLTERSRGASGAPADDLVLKRQLWLDFDGGGYTAHDEITGSMSRSWRLEMGPRTRLGRVVIDGRDQLITRLAPDAPAGIEVRSQSLNIAADSRIEGGRFRVPAVSFASDFRQASLEVALPPGWRLLHAGGADHVRGAWLDAWSLMDLFLLLITGVAIHRLFGWRTGALAFAAVGLTITEPGAPRTLWLFVLLAEALARALPDGRLRLAARAYRLSVWVVLVAVCAPYAVRELRAGLHPGAASSISEAGQMEPVRTHARGLRARGGPDESFLAKPAAAPAPQSQGGIGGLSDLAPRKEAQEPEQAAARRTRHKAMQDYDPSIVVQTGPGLPTWRWQTTSLRFNGPVARDHELRLYLLPPGLNLLLAFARVAALAALAFVLLRRPLRFGRRTLPGRAALAGLVFLIAVPAARTARAEELPSQALLEELKTRLVEPPACSPHCASIARMTVTATPADLRIALELSAVAPTGLPLPGDADGWLPTMVLLNGQPAPALHRETGGKTLWLAVPRGVARVLLAGPLPPRETVQLAVPLSPGHTTVDARGWTVDGLREDGVVEDSLKLTRERGATAPSTEGLTAATLPPFVSVQRTLRLGLEWEVETLVERRSTPEAPLAVDIPLLAGESVTTPGVHVVQPPTSGRPGSVAVVLAPGQTSAAWRSTLARTPEILLRADPDVAPRAAEVWRLELGATWHATFAGIPAANAPAQEGPRTLEWAPWPGEEVRIQISRPTGAEGQTLTIQRALLQLTPGLRSTRASLELELRSSRGTTHALILPEGAELDSVSVDGTPQPIRPEGRRLEIPVSPRSQEVAVTWHEASSLRLFYRAPEVDVGAPATNVELRISLESALRWILYVRGPSVGPAVLFWSLLVVLVLAGLGLGRTNLCPLRARDWILLGLGLSQVGLLATGIVLALFLGLGWRTRYTVTKAWLYNLTQIVLAILAVATAIALTSAIENGLLAHPDMLISGEGSSNALLFWYQDRTGPRLPRPLMISTSLLTYRAAMLAWSLWLALACLRWAKWIWSAARTDGLWRPLRTRVVSPPPSGDER